jgi:hypothetical protein
MLAFIARPFVALALAAVVLTSCSAPSEKVGQLIVSVDSDMALPQDVDTVHVEVLAGGGKTQQLGGDFGIGSEPGEILLPATLTILAGKDPSTPVTVRVVGKKGPKSRTLREITSTVPDARTAWLRMPVQWLCDGTAKADTTGNVTSTCGDGYTCAAGSCVQAETPVADLPEFHPESVFGGGDGPDNGACYDTLNCMAGGAITTPVASDADDCHVTLKGTEPTNVALQVAGEGICNDDGTLCYVPLDNDQKSGFWVDGGTLTLPPKVCEKLSNGAASALVTSTTCPSKTAGLPTCGPWSSVSTPSTPPPKEDEKPPVPQLVTTLTLPSGAGSSFCCGLQGDAGTLYACSCTKKGDVELLGIAEGGTSPQTAASFALASPVTTLGLGVLAGTVFWRDRDPDTKVSLIGEAYVGKKGTTTFTTKYDLYDGSPLLGDDGNYYSLGDPTQGGNPQLIVVDRTLKTSSGYEVGASEVPLGWATLTQDEKAVYLVANDTSDSKKLKSSVVGFDKAKTKPAELTTLSTTPGSANGYAGLASTGTDSLALLLLQTNTDDALLYQPWLFEPGSTSDQNLTGLGAPLKTNGGTTHHPILLAATTEGSLIATFAAAADGTIASSSVLIASRSLADSRLVADFRGDNPLAGAVSKDGKSLYWLMASGRLYRIATAQWVQP